MRRFDATIALLSYGVLATMTGTAAWDDVHQGGWHVALAVVSALVTGFWAWQAVRVAKSLWRWDGERWRVREADELWVQAEANERDIIGRVMARRSELPKCRRCDADLRLKVMHGVGIYECPAHGAGWRSKPKTS